MYLGVTVAVAVAVAVRGAVPPEQVGSETCLYYDCENTIFVFYVEVHCYYFGYCACRSFVKNTHGTSGNRIT